MTVGLKSILNSINRDPSNQILINRYITLVRELEVDAEKARSTLDLAKVLRKYDPHSAMEYGFMVFQFDRLCIEALELIASCLRDLGRLGKAEVIEQEAIKLRRVRQSNSVDERNQSSKRSFIMEASNVSVDGVTVGVFQSDHSVISKPIENMKTIQLPPIPSPTVSEEKNLNDLTNQDEKKTILISSLPTSANMKSVKNVGSVSEEHQNEVLPSKPYTYHSETADSLGEDFDRSGSSSNWDGPDLGVLLELFDFYYRQGLTTDAKGLLESCADIASHMPWWQARRSMLERCGIVLQTSSEKSRLAKMQSKSEKPSRRLPRGQENLLPSKSEPLAELAQLRQLGKSRIALQKIREISSEELSLEWATALYEELLQIAGELSLRPFEWKSSAGPSDFADKVTKRMQPTASFSVI